MKFSEMFDRKYLGRVAALVFGVAASVGVLFYVGYHFYEKFSPGLDLVDARITTVTDTIYADAYIMRSESPLYSTVGSGSVVPEQHDGAHVQTGGLIAEVYSQSSPDVERRIDEIDEQIALFEKNKAEDRSVQSTSGIESSIYDTLGSIRKSAESGNYADALSLRTGLLVNIKKRAILTGEITDYDAQIAKLKNEKENLRAGLGTCLQTVYAGGAGYYFSEYDGYGGQFSADLIDTLTYEDFIAMTLSAQPDTRQTFGVIVTDYSWYIACEMPKTDAGVLDEMGRCDVLFTYSGVTLRMDVERVIPQTPGERAVVILRSGKMPEGFDYTRMQPVEISARQYRGFEIPAAAVRVSNGYEGVYIMDEVTIRFRRINVIYESDGRVICTGDPTDDITVINENKPDEQQDDGAEPAEYEWIRQNDVVVVGGTELYNGKVVGGK